VPAFLLMAVMAGIGTFSLGDSPLSDSRGLFIGDSDFFDIGIISIEGTGLLEGEGLLKATGGCSSLSELSLLRIGIILESSGGGLNADLEGVMFLWIYSEGSL